MAKFCTKCGKPLVDGKPCTCQDSKKEKIEDLEEDEKEEKVKNIKEVEDEPKIISKKENIEDDEEPKKTVKKEKKSEEEEEDSNDSQVSSMFSEVIDIIKGLFTKPVATLEKYSGISNFNIAICSLVVNAILFGFVINTFIAACLKKFGLDLSSVQTIINQTVSTLNNYGLNIKINTNFWLSGTIAMVIVSALIVGIIYLMHTQVYKKKINIKKVVVLVGNCELLLSVGFLLTIIGSYINLFIALIFLAASSIMFYIELHQGYMLITKTNKDQSFYIYLLSVVVPIVGFIIIMLVATIASVVISLCMYFVQQTRTTTSSGLGL